VSQAGSDQITNICSHFVVTKTLKPAWILAICENFGVVSRPRESHPEPLRRTERETLASLGSHYPTSQGWHPGEKESVLGCDDKEEGRERKVEVKVLSGDYKLFYRQRYFEQTRKEIAKSDAAPAKDPFLGLMGRGMPNISEIPYHLKVVAAAIQPRAGTLRAGENAQLSGKLTRYGIGFRLLPSGLLLPPDTDDARRKRLEVLLVVYSQDGKPLNWESRTIRLLMKPEQWARARTEGISFHFEIDAPPGDVYLRTGVYDASQSKVGTLEIPLGAIPSAQN